MQHERSAIWIRFSWALILAVAAGVCVAEEPVHGDRLEQRLERPVDRFVVSPWRPSEDLVEWQEVVRSRTSRDHFLWSPEELRLIKKEVATLPGVPKGTALDAVEAELEAEDLGGIASPLAPKATQRIEGVNRLETGFDRFIFFPPDTHVAASESHLLEVANVAARLSDRDGRNEQIEPLNNLFAVRQPEMFDPKVYYDRFSQRFYLIVLFQKGKKSFIYLAVSRSSAPGSLSAPDEFCTYKIKAKRNGSWADYPSIGANENWFVISVNNFKFDSGRLEAVYLYAMNTRRLSDNSEGACPKLQIDRFRVKQDPNLRPAFTLQPAQHYSSSTLPGTPLFLVSSQPFISSRSFMLARLITLGDGSPALQSEALTGTTYVVPPDSPQKGGADLHTGDMRMMQAAYRDGVIWSVMSTACELGGGTNESCVRAMQITPTADGSSITFEETFGKIDWYFYWPGVAINRNGDVAVVFQRSRQGKYLGVAFNGKRSSREVFDANIRVLRNGTCPIENIEAFVNRTGDYTGAQTDPKDDLSFFIAGEYADRFDNGRCDWHTRIGRVKY